MYGTYLHTLDVGVDPALVEAYGDAATSGTYGLWTMRKHYLARLIGAFPPSLVLEIPELIKPQ